MITPDRWNKSSRSSGNGGNCVETRAAPGFGAVWVRDSKDPHGPALAISPADWSTFTAAVKAGDLNA